MIPGVRVKEELPEMADFPPDNHRIKLSASLQPRPPTTTTVIAISSGCSSSNYAANTDNSDGVAYSRASKRPKGLLNTVDDSTMKKPKLEINYDRSYDERNPNRFTEVILPVGFLDPLPSEGDRRCSSPLPFRSVPHANGGEIITMKRSPPASVREIVTAAENPGALVVQSNKQFWKAGDYEGEGPNGGDYSDSHYGSMDHLRVHPKFLHSNATSHKWALGAVAELLDNALDEVCNGASYVSVDTMVNQKDQSRMLLVQDNGGGMTPEKMRSCVSLGYSAKRKLANTIGQYGNGFKTSTMRLGADVIVFSCCIRKENSSPTRSIGMLSYTFLRGTHKEDIVVPMVDFEMKDAHRWTRLVRKSPEDWCKNIETIARWSPFSSEEELRRQFDFLEEHGTRIIIYNLWEDDTGRPELDFDIDKHDIQIHGVRDEKKIQMAEKYPHCRHYLTYYHSLRSYASVLYLRLPQGFRIILRGKDVDHHNLVDDMMLTKKNRYKPKPIPGVPQTDSEMVADFTIGFAKGSKDHIDIQGFNVYHKNRLIKPFWRVWNAAGSDGRGVIGVLEANFVEPAHDKQGFERTVALQRLETQLLKIQKGYWRDNCHQIGYAARRNIKNKVSPKREARPPNGGIHVPSCHKGTPNGKSADEDVGLTSSSKGALSGGKPPCSNGHGSWKEFLKAGQDDKTFSIVSAVASGQKATFSDHPASLAWGAYGKRASMVGHSVEYLFELREENIEIRRRLQEIGGTRMVDLVRELDSERERAQSLELKIAEMDKEQEDWTEIFTEERERRDIEEEKMRKTLESQVNLIQTLRKEIRERDDREGNLRNKIQDASNVMEKLLEKIKRLERN